MTYYRIALQNHEKTLWAWKTSPLTSLHAVVRLLRSYSALPPERIRVFTASTKEQLNEMLSHENAGRVSGSSTATQFLLARKLNVSWATQNTPEQQVIQYSMIVRPVRQEVGVSACPSLLASHSSTARSFDAGDMNFFDRRRFEIEYGLGSDHDAPYCFMFPTFIPQLLAWFRLQARVRAGELES